MVNIFPFLRTATTRVRREWRSATGVWLGRRRPQCRSAWTGSSNTRRRRRWSRAIHSGDNTRWSDNFTSNYSGHATQGRARTVCGTEQHSATEIWLRSEQNMTFARICLKAAPLKDLKRWWYHMRCSGGVMRVVSRAWADVARQTRRPWHSEGQHCFDFQELYNSCLVNCDGEIKWLWRC